MLKYNKQKGISERSEEKSQIFLDFAKYLSEKGISLTFHDLPPPKKINPWLSMTFPDFPENLQKTKIFPDFPDCSNPVEAT